MEAVAVLSGERHAPPPARLWALAGSGWVHDVTPDGVWVETTSSEDGYSGVMFRRR